MRGSQKTQVLSFNGQVSHRRTDAVVQEEPLEIRLQATTLTTTMRTGGHDFELALGWAFAEGLVQSLEDVQKISYCVSDKLEQRFNVVNLKLRNRPEVSPKPRLSLSTSACGVCGKASLESLEVSCPVLPNHMQVLPELLYALPEKIRTAQQIFSSTGSIHAAGLFSANGDLLILREDVGRHNAVDKVIGWALMNRIQLEQTMLLVSGRSGFEIAQKAVRASIPILAGVSAPSSLALDVAKRFNLTLIGFLRGQTMNVYTGFERIQTTDKAVE